MGRAARTQRPDARRSSSARDEEETWLECVISERDLVRALAREQDPGGALVSAFATADIVTASLDEDLGPVGRRMIDHGIRHLPMVGDEGELAGVVSMRDLFALETLLVDPGGKGEQPG